MLALRQSTVGLLVAQRVVALEVVQLILAARAQAVFSECFVGPTVPEFARFATGDSRNYSTDRWNGIG
jgi:hypothetical protein